MRRDILEKKKRRDIPEKKKMGRAEKTLDSFTRN